LKNKIRQVYKIVALLSWCGKIIMVKQYFGSKLTFGVIFEVNGNKWDK